MESAGKGDRAMPQTMQGLLEPYITVIKKVYSQQLSHMTYGFNSDNDLGIKPIGKSESHFKKWGIIYQFYANFRKEGVVLYGTAAGAEL